MSAKTGNWYRDIRVFVVTRAINRKVGQQAAFRDVRNRGGDLFGMGDVESQRDQAGFEEDP